jgi:hypothetical protein
MKFLMLKNLSYLWRLWWLMLFCCVIEEELHLHFGQACFRLLLLLGLVAVAG